MLCINRAPHLNGKAVVIGRLDDESLRLIQRLENSVIMPEEHPSNIALRIKDCGLIDDDTAQSALAF